MYRARVRRCLLGALPALFSRSKDGAARALILVGWLSFELGCRIDLDEVGHHGSRAGEHKLSKAALGIALLDCKSFVLAQVIRPGVDHVRLDEAVRLRWVAVEIPLIGSTLPAQWLEALCGSNESLLVLRRHLVVERHHHRPILGARLANEHRFRPMERG